MSTQFRAICLVLMAVMILSRPHVALASAPLGPFTNSAFPRSYDYGEFGGGYYRPLGVPTPRRHLKPRRKPRTLLPIRLCRQSAAAGPLPTAERRGEAAFRIGDYRG